MEKIKSTKLGVAAGAIGVLYQLEASPWTIVVVAGIYMITNAVQTIGEKKPVKEYRTIKKAELE